MSNQAPSPSLPGPAIHSVSAGGVFTVDARGVFNLVRIFAGRTQPDHLKRFFALFGTRSWIEKDRVPALAQETRFLVQNFSNFKILTKFDGYRRAWDVTSPHQGVVGGEQRGWYQRVLRAG